MVAFNLTMEKASKDIPTDSIPLQVRMSNLVQRREWKKAEEFALQLRSRVLSTINLFEVEYMNCIRRVELEKGLCADLKEKGSVMEAQLKDMAFKDKLKDAGVLKNFRNASKRMKSCKLGDNELIIFKPLSMRAEYIVALGYTGYWGAFHAIFNQHFEKFVPTPISTTELSELSRTLKKAQLNVSRDLLKLYKVTGRGNRDEMSNASISILRSQQSSLIWLPSLCATISALTCSVLNGDIDCDARIIGAIDLLGGKLARSWILLTTYALYLTFLTFVPPQDSTLQHAITMARRLPFNQKAKKIKSLSPEELWTNRNQYYGKYVELSGFVRNLIKRRTKGGMLLNRFEVYEPTSKQFVRVVVIFEEIGRMGLVNTTSVKLYGTWKQTSKIANTPILQLERLRISELKKRYGLDFIIDRVRPWFDYFPNSYHGYWSVRPQLKVESNRRGPLTGAGELIYIRPYCSLMRGV
jgi:hypothetical protein